MGAAHDYLVPLDGVIVEGVEGLAHFEHYVVGDVYNIIDRPHARQGDSPLHPGGRGAGSSRMMPSCSPDRPSSASDMTIPSVCTPLILAGLRVDHLGGVACWSMYREPIRPSTTVSPSSIFGAPVTTVISLPVPYS